MPVFPRIDNTQYMSDPEHQPTNLQAAPENIGTVMHEDEILELIGRGINNPEIAQKLTISMKTVRNHVSNIFNKLQVTDRVQAAIRAREAGLGQDRAKP